MRDNSQLFKTLPPPSQPSLSQPPASPRISATDGDIPWILGLLQREVSSFSVMEEEGSTKEVHLQVALIVHDSTLRPSEQMGPF